MKTMLNTLALVHTHLSFCLPRSHDYTIMEEEWVVGSSRAGRRQWFARMVKRLDGWERHATEAK